MSYGASWRGRQLGSVARSLSIWVTVVVDTLDEQHLGWDDLPSVHEADAVSG